MRRHLISATDLKMFVRFPFESERWFTALALIKE